MLSLVYGSAFEGSVLRPDEVNVRIYRNDGRTFIGHDTTDIAHVCDKGCMFQAIDDSIYAPADIDSTVFVSVDTETRVDGLTYVSTIDVVDFDPGDDTYILCAACGAELLRDDERHFEQYGRHIGE